MNHEDNQSRGRERLITVLLFMSAGLWFLLGAWTVGGRLELPTPMPLFFVGTVLLGVVGFRLWRSRNP